MVKFIRIPPTVYVKGNYKINDFEMCIYPITQEAWKSVMGDCYNYDFQSEDCPVEKVSFIGVEEFIKKLNQRTNSDYRLPTAEEWEWAAKGGICSNNYKYSGSNILSEVAWDADNSGSETNPVGLKRPNELGLYDMTGNVWEWCNDEDYKGNKLLKGGGYTNYYDGKIFNISYRDFYQNPEIKNAGPYGFRLVKEIESTKSSKDIRREEKSREKRLNELSSKFKEENRKTGNTPNFKKTDDDEFTLEDFFGCLFWVIAGVLIWVLFF